MEFMSHSFSRIILCILATLACAGCATHAHRVSGVREDFYRGRIEQAGTTVETLVESHKRDADAFLLDQAVISLTSGNPRKAERILREVRDRLDYLEQKDAGEQVLSLLDDDQQIAWAGEDYEKILLRSYLTITNLLNGGEDATAYALQIDEKQDEVLARLEKIRTDEADQAEFKRVALGPYLHAAMLEERHLDYDDIERSRLKVVSWETDFRDGKSDLDRARHGRHSEPGHGVVYLFCMVGRGPIKVEAAEIPTHAALLVADRILSNASKHEVTPTVAPVKVPIVEPGRSLITNVQVLHNEEPLGETTTITNVSEFAIQQAEANLPQVIGRAVARRAIKKATIYAAQDRVDSRGTRGAGLALTLAGIAWEASENADTRCWGLLPDQIQVLRIELPAGQQQLTLQPQLANSPTGEAASIHVNVEDGRNTYVLATIPDREFVGEILTSSR